MSRAFMFISGYKKACFNSAINTLTVKSTVYPHTVFTIISDIGVQGRIQEFWKEGAIR